MRRCLVPTVLVLLAGTPALADPVPAPQVSKLRQVVRTVRGKLMTNAMDRRIRRASLAPPIERLLLHNVSKIAANGERYGTFSLFGYGRFQNVEAVGRAHRRTVWSDRDSPLSIRPRSLRVFTLKLGRIGAEARSARYIPLTPNVTVSQIGNKPAHAIEHRDGRVTQRIQLKQNSSTRELDRARNLLEQGGLTLAQALRKAELVQ